jgi:phosphonopyruvate decarboxylase
MIQADDFLDGALAAGFDTFSGVPCSLAGPLFRRIEARADLRYVGAVNEGDAVAIAAGAWLAGRGSGVICQNSGFANTINPLASLNAPYEIPVLMVVTMRGEPGMKDEPQHEVMGRITPGLLESLGIAVAPFPRTADALPAALAEARDALAARRSRALLLGKGTIADDGHGEAVHEGTLPRGVELRFDGGVPMKRFEAIERLLAMAPPDAAIVSTTGMCSRELFTLDDRDRNFYVVGSMGCALPIGLGVALNHAGPVVVIDGDGAALMRMGSLATAGQYAPGNLVHVILDNGAHDSTGGQRTVSPGVDFAGVALACGYGLAATCRDAAGLEAAFRAACASTRPALIRVRIERGAMPNLGRPTIGPPDVARRFRSFLAARG